ncbi:MAG: DUF6435 family protein [Pseudomonadota bacterium]
MLSVFKSNPVKKLKKQYSAKLEQAMHAQRRGNIEGYSQLTYEAQEILKHIESLENSTTTRS